MSIISRTVGLHQLNYIAWNLIKPKPTFPENDASTSKLRAGYHHYKRACMHAYCQLSIFLLRILFLVI